MTPPGTKHGMERRGKLFAACTSTWSRSQNLHTHLFMTAWLRRSALASASDSVVGGKRGRLISTVRQDCHFQTVKDQTSGWAWGWRRHWYCIKWTWWRNCASLQTRRNGTEWESLFSKAQLSVTERSYHTHGWPLHATLCTHPKISPKLNSVRSTKVPHRLYKSPLDETIVV